MFGPRCLKLFDLDLDVSMESSTYLLLITLCCDYPYHEKGGIFEPM